ncbi:MAG: Cell wall-associated hydrolases (invasion-associated proteins) [uncultured Paraburkholderia sp.]|nr:MAG: Cell wall-associated hydrolases (invasion-associated proteins) [uncultured Paraburkholderia sp.]CAH2940799.1 MAG: Cell wall-associated hydrolases (invasion-associated proteins) [uncultured Paraburkholderia sp.]
MRRVALSLLTVLLLAACASLPQKTSSRGSGLVVVTNGAYHAPPPGFPNFVDHSIGREEISIQAMSLVGIPYRWGGNTPDAGFDCSGLVRYVVRRAASVDLPRTTADISGRGETIQPDEIAPGDLIFFNTTGRAHSHVGIYVSKLRFVNAPSMGGTVRLDYLTNPYWAKHFDGIRRVAGPAAKPAPFDAPSYQAQAPQQPERGEAVGTVAAAATSAVTAPAVSVAAQRPVAAQAYAGDSASTASPARAGMPIQVPVVAGAQPMAPVSSSSASPVPQADAFESPPPCLSAAQMQVRAAGAVSPSTVRPAQANAYEPPAVMSPQQTASGRAVAPAPSGAAPDAIDAAADAFEPPPSASVAERQARQARQADNEGGGTVQVMRASTGSRGVPAPTQSNDDPIARFANGNF